MAFEPVIGIEVHAQLKTNTKLFCGCPTTFGQATNSHVCPVCLGLPGALPVLNRQTVLFAIRAGLALNCQIQPQSVFARKNYFYPDLPKGYQISQFDLPLCTGGYVDIVVDGQPKRIGVTRIHMEEDAGKLLHQGAEAISGATHSLVDLNRACTPLIEIVSEPDIRSAQEAKIYVETLKQILEHIGVCDGNLEEGSLRADANVSIRPVGQDAFGTKTEVKNLNSFRSIERAVIYEIKRQEEALGRGEAIVQQTRHYDDTTQKTRAMRSKEEAHDYRYFPDPDLLPLVVTPQQIEEVRAQLPELPQARRKRYRDLGLGEHDCETLLNDLARLAYFDACVAVKGEVAPKLIANWILGEMTAVYKEGKHGFEGSPIIPERFVAFLLLIQTDKISGKIGKELLPKLIGSTQSPSELVASLGVSQMTDTSALDGIIADILAANPDVIEKVKSGKTNAADFLIGQVMKQTRGQAKPDLVRELIHQKIQSL